MQEISTTTNKINTTICLVAILKDEERFLNEWIIYHRMIGIDHFFLYDDDPALPLKQLLIPHSEYCTIIPWRNSENTVKQGNQLRAYNHAAKNYITTYEWVIFLDADEFIVLNKHSSVPAFLDEHKNHTAISLKWLIFGHNGLFDEPTRLITSSLNRRMSTPSTEVKTFTHTAAISNITYPHYCNLKYGSRIILGEDDIIGNEPGKAYINHYQCRSFTNWMKRVQRGDVNFNAENSPSEHNWRLSDQACLKEFITNVAYNKNELIDNGMLNNRFSIQENIAKLDKSPALFSPGEIINNFPEIEKQISSIANYILKNISKVSDIGLYNGKAGLILFLFSYARFSGNLHYHQTALNIIDEISDQITTESAAGYVAGVAGVGSLIELLIFKGFVKTDSNETLSDIDELLHYHLISNPRPVIEMNEGITGLGKYFMWRLANPLNDYHHPRERANTQILSEIINLLDASYDTYDELLSVIDLLSCSYPYIDNKKQIQYYINYAADKLETMIYEDNHFSAFPVSFDLLSVVTTLFKAHNKTGLTILSDKASHFLKNHENMIAVVKSDDRDATFSITNYSNYLMLYGFTGDPFFKNAITHQFKAIQSNLSFMADTCSENLSLYNGIAGQGMALLSAITTNGIDWLNILTPAHVKKI